MVGHGRLGTIFVAFIWITYVQAQLTFSVTEEKPAGTLVGTIAGIDDTYSLQDTTFFRITRTDGTWNLVTNTVIDRESLDNDVIQIPIVSTNLSKQPVEVSVNVLDINDNNPYFAISPLILNLTEGTTTTQHILPSALDDDAGANAAISSYSIVSGNTDIFQVRQATEGNPPVLYLNLLAPLDRERKARYELNISAEDTGGRQGFLRLIVNVQDVNDESPKFTPFKYKKSFPEDTAVGAILFAVQAEDLDSGDNGAVTYSLPDQTRPGTFRVNATSGDIILNEPLDYEDLETHTVTVVAEDGGSPSMTGAAIVTVDVTNVNDNDPEISFRYTPKSASIASVSEDMEIGTLLAVVSASDRDETDKSRNFPLEIISGNDLGHFELVKLPLPNVAKILLADNESISQNPSYNLTVRADDPDPESSRFSLASMLVLVNSANDHPPVFEKSEKRVSISETVHVGSIVASVHASDPDSGISGRIVYEITEGNNLGFFAINTHTGLITTAKRLRFNTVPGNGTISLQISAKDETPNPRITEATVTITIQDENDNAPIFDEVFYRYSVTENRVGNIGRVRATDGDYGANGALEYHLSRVQCTSSVTDDQETDWMLHFSVSPTDGDVAVTIGLDREVTPACTLSVAASDKGDPVMTSVVDVTIEVTDVNDNNPMFYPREYFRNLPSNFPVGEVIATLHATDLDFENDVTYSFYNLQANLDRYYSIDPSSGSVSLKRGISSRTGANDVITVTAVDQGGNPSTKNATLSIIVGSTSTSAAFTKESYVFEILENSKELYKVGQAAIVNANPVAFSIAGGDERGVFEIGSNGVIRTSAQSRLDREAKGSYTLTVFCEYQENTAGERGYLNATVTINVKDVNDRRPVFTDLSAKATRESDTQTYNDTVTIIVTDSSAELLLYNIHAVDADSGANGNIQYSISSSYSDALVDSDGKIYIRPPTSLMTSPICGEEAITFDAIANACDQGAPVLCSTLRLKVRLLIVERMIAVPLPNLFLTLPENVAVNSRVAVVETFDAVVEDIAGNISYEIMPADSPFAVFPDGQILLVENLDFEVEHHYELTLSATISLGTAHWNAQSILSIDVIDANDNDPIPSTQHDFLLKEIVQPESVIGQIAVKDADDGIYSSLEYKIDDSSPASALFFCDRNSGMLQTTGSLQREVLAAFGLDSAAIPIDVIVRDQAGEDTPTSSPNSVSVAATFTIDMEDRYPLRFEPDFSYLEIVENRAPGVVLKVSASDGDSTWESNKVSYAIYDAELRSSEIPFGIDESTGSVFLKPGAVLDREEREIYELTAQARYEDDSDACTTAVVIRVLDVKDSPPIFREKFFQFSLLESSSVSTVFGRVFADAGDIVTKDTVLQYTLQSGASVFGIDSETGFVYLAGSVDYETQREYNVTVTVTDGSGESSSTYILVSVLDANDNVPIFIERSSSPITEGSYDSPVQIADVRAFDADSGKYSEIRYELVSANPRGFPGISGPQFGIGERSGAVTVTGVVDREASPTLKVTVRACNMAEKSPEEKCTDTTVSVRVVDRNDNKPRFTNAPATLLSRSSSRSSGGCIMQLSAIDPDDGKNGEVSLSIARSGSSASLFRIDDDGCLIPTTPLTDDVIYQVDVTATDGGSPPLSTTMTVNVVIGEATARSSSAFQGFTNPVVVSERSGPGTIAQLSAASGRSSQTRYFITSPPTSSDGRSPGSRIAIDSDTGDLSLDETVEGYGGRTYSAEVIAVEQTSSQPRISKTQVSIQVSDENDHAPLFNSDTTRVSISEDAEEGTPVTTVTASDDDVFDDITYSLIDENGGEPSAFSVDPKSGRVTVSASGVDREAGALQRLRVVADDSVHRSSTELQITVRDVNDNPPKFQSDTICFDVAENSFPRTVIGRLSATDADVDSTISYTLREDQYNGMFRVHNELGVITFESDDITLDRETRDLYVLKVRATDQGGLYSDAEVLVYISDVNDHQPVFQMEGNSVVEIEEDATLGSYVTTVRAVDGDIGRYADIVYSIIGGDPAKRFYIDAFSGEIRTQELLDREKQEWFNLTLMATNRDAPYSFKRYTTTTLDIRLVDINDNPPLFYVPPVSYLKENAQVGDIVFPVTVIDLDLGSGGDFRVELVQQSPDHDAFKLDATGAALIVKNSDRLDFDSTKEYNITLMAYDQGDEKLSSTANVLIKIIDVNDHEPLFEETSYSATLNQNSVVGTRVTSVRARDADSGYNGEIRFFLLESANSSYFYIDKYSGDVFLANALNRETASEFTVTIRAEDRGADTKSSAVSLVVTIEGDNDCAPIFTPSYHVVEVKENGGAANTVLLRLTAKDAISNNNDDVVIRGGVTSTPSSDAFALESVSNGVADLVLRKSLDREMALQYELKINAFRRGSPSNIGSAYVLVLVEDKNDNVPVFDQYQYYATIPEDLKPGSLTATIAAEDEDSGAITYQLSDESAAQPFYIDATTGQVYTRGILDREQVPLYNLTVFAYDEPDSEGTQNVVSVQLYVTITDVNDNAPAFRNSDVTIYVNPKDTDLMLMIAEAKDPDEGENGRVSYSISGSDKFAIDSATGAVTTLQSPDGGATFQVKATDSGQNARSSLMEVQVYLTDKRRPDISTDIENLVQLSEDTLSGHSLGQFTATTSRSDGTPISFSLKGDRFGWFSIHPNDGELSVVGTLDFEKASNIVLWVEATDSGSPQLTAFQMLTVQISDVNDNAPNFDDDVYIGHVKEDEIKTILTVSARDPDQGANGEVEFSFVESLSDDVSNFILDSETGEIRSKVLLDRETDSRYNLVVRASDRGSPALYRDVNVHVIVDDVNDNPPVFTRLFSATVREDAAVGSYVLQVTSTDEDEKQTHTYELTNDSNGAFSIDDKGYILVAKQLDREAAATHTLVVEAYDGKWRPHTTVTINVEDVNDNQPRFATDGCQASVSSSTSIGTVIMQINGSDADSGANGEIRYRIPGGHQYFAVDTTGQITTTSELNCAKDCPLSYSFGLVACDGGYPQPSCRSCGVTVAVKSVNRNTPSFGYSDVTVALLQTTPVGSEVYQVHATDEDPGTILRYEILDRHQFSYFEMESNNRIILHSSVSGLPVGDTLQASVKATDDGVPPKSAILNILFEITGENQHSPVFSRSVYGAGPVPENSPPGRVVVEVQATDADAGINGEVTYEITTGNKDSIFVIDEKTGAITLVETLDREKNLEYSLVVTATDKGAISRNASASVRIPVLDLNDNLPEFNSSHFEVQVPESAPLNSVVTTIFATDADTGENAQITYSANSASPLSIRPLTGEIYVSKQLDYESEPVHTLKIFAQNNGVAKKVEAVLTVYVRPENEFPPEFLETTFEFDLPFSAPIGTRFGHVNATDRDSGDDGIVEYDFEQSTDSNNFALDRISGIITVAKTLPYSVGDIVTLRVIATNPTSSSDACLFDDAIATVNIISDQCRLAPCKNNATCKDGLTSATCICAPGYTGQFCEQEKDECASNPCARGTCRDLLNAFSCTCDAGYTGRLCDVEINFCEGQPCLNGGTCSNNEISYACQCPFGATGSDCGTNSINFSAQSFIVVDDVSQRIEFEFSTVSSPSLLFYTMLDTGSIAVESINGNLRLSVQTSQSSAVEQLVISSNFVDGQWHTLKFDISQSAITLQVDTCPSADGSCYGVLPLPQPLDLASGDIVIGGIRSVDDLASGKLSSHDFVGCMRSLRVDTRDIPSSSSTEIKESAGISNGCARATSTSLCSSDRCSNRGSCTDLWNSTQCDCEDERVGETCDTQKVGKGFPGTGYVTIQFTESYTRDAFLENAGAVRARRRRNTGSQSSSVEIRFRTSVSDGILVFIADKREEYYASLYVENGLLTYEQKVVEGLVRLQTADDISDGEWHTVKVEIRQIDDVTNDVILEVDSNAALHENFEGVITKFGDPLLIQGIYIGGKPTNILVDFSPSESFRGCLFDFKLDSVTYQLNSDVTNYAVDVIMGDAGISVGCGSEGFCSDVICSGDKVCSEESASCICQEGYNEIDGKCAAVTSAAGLQWWIILIIVLLSVLFVVGALIFAICLKRKGVWKSSPKAIEENATSDSTFELQAKKRDTPDLVPDDVYTVPADDAERPRENGSIPNHSSHATLSSQSSVKTEERNGKLPHVQTTLPAVAAVRTPTPTQYTMAELPRLVQRPASAQPKLMPTPSPIMMSQIGDITSLRRSKTPNGLYSKTLPKHTFSNSPLSYLYQNSAATSRSTSRNSSRIHSLPKSSHQRRRSKPKSQTETLEGMMRELSGIVGLTNEEFDLLHAGVRALENGHDPVLYDDASSVSTSSLTDLSMQSRTTSSSARVRSFVRSTSPQKDVSLRREQLPNAVVNASLQTLNRASPARREVKDPFKPIAAAEPFEFPPPPSDLQTSESSESSTDGEDQDWDSDSSDSTAISTIRKGHSSTASSSVSGGNAGKLDVNFPTNMDGYFSSLMDVFGDLSDLKSDGSHGYRPQGRRVSAYPGFVGHEISMWSEIEKLSKRPLKKVSQRDSVLTNISQSSMEGEEEARPGKRRENGSRSSTPNRQHFYGMALVKDKRTENHVTSPLPKAGDDHMEHKKATEGEHNKREKNAVDKRSRSSTPNRQQVGGMVAAREQRKDKRLSSPSPKFGGHADDENKVKRSSSAMSDRSGPLSTSTSSSSKSGRNSRRAEFIKYI